MSRITTEAVIKVFVRAFEEHGRPIVLVTDNGPSYRSAEFREFLEKCDVTQILIPAHYGASNVLAERFVKTLKEAMIKYSVDEPGNKWSENVPKIVSRYNSTKHRETGFTPVELCDVGSDHWHVANERTMKQQKYDSERLNMKRTAPQLKVGSLVYIDKPKRFQRKFAVKRSGPFRVCKKLNAEIFLTNEKRRGAKRSTVHASNARVLS